MRVLAYLVAYPPARYIGSELMTARLLEELSAAGHEVTVVAETYYGEEYVRRGVRVVPRRPLLMSHTISSDFDLVVTHPELGEYIFPRAKGIPYIGIVHNTREAVHEGLKKRRPNHVVYNSQQMADELDPDFGIPYTVVRPPLRIDRRAMREPNARQFVTAVNLTKDKGGDVFWWVAKERPHIQFLGVLGGYGEQIIHHDMANVWLLGQSPDMGLVWSMTHTAIFPSVHESYGMAAVEAASAGVPVIASDLPGPREALGDAAVFVAPDDPMGWLTAIDVSWSDKGWEAASYVGAARGRELERRTVRDMQRWVALAEDMATAPNG